MEPANIQFSNLSFSQKLNLMEAIWDDLTKNEALFESPAWHEEELKDRDKACASGNTKISDWNDAKKRIRKNVACE
ncbi:MAG: addiction module protein [Deltaproteobacteria bacterium]|nr:addiction module protein [Deltaproteobacteria bacterium]